MPLHVPLELSSHGPHRADGIKLNQAVEQPRSLPAETPAAKVKGACHPVPEHLTFGVLTEKLHFLHGLDAKRYQSEDCQQ